MLRDKKTRRPPLVIFGLLVTIILMGADIGVAHATGDALTCTGGAIKIKIAGGLHTGTTGTAFGTFKVKTGKCSGAGAFAGIAKGKGQGQFQAVVSDCTLFTKSQTFGLATFGLAWTGTPKGRSSGFSLVGTNPTSSSFAATGSVNSPGTGAGDTFHLSADPVSAATLTGCSSRTGLRKLTLTNVTLTIP